MFSIFGKKVETSESVMKIPALFCINCFNNKKAPAFYSLCRVNNSTKLRHMKTFHPGRSLSDIKFLSPKEFAAKDAFNKWKNSKTKKVSLKLRTVLT